MERGEFDGLGWERDRRQMQEYMRYLQASSDQIREWERAWENYYKKTGNRPTVPDPWEMENGYAIGVYKAICAKIKRLMEEEDGGIEDEKGVW